MWPGYDNEIQKGVAAHSRSDEQQKRSEESRDQMNEHTRDSKRRRKSTTMLSTGSDTRGGLHHSLREDYQHQQQCYEPIEVGHLLGQSDRTMHNEGDANYTTQGYPSPLQRQHSMTRAMDMAHLQRSPLMDQFHPGMTSTSPGLSVGYELETRRLIEEQQRLLHRMEMMSGGAGLQGGIRQQPITQQLDALLRRDHAQTTNNRMEQTATYRDSAASHPSYAQMPQTPPMAAAYYEHMHNLEAFTLGSTLSGSSAALHRGRNPVSASLPPGLMYNLPSSGPVYPEQRRSRPRSPDTEDILAVVPRPPMPSYHEGPLRKHTNRKVVPLGINEDPNWLSQFLCFVRSDLVEVFRANSEDVSTRMNSKRVTIGQIGIRCRFCAHLTHGERANRASSFPSSMSRIYQSLTMMVRDHFASCNLLPATTKETFLALKSKTTQGATDSKKYWVDSAMVLGMSDTPHHGIMCSEASQSAALLESSSGLKAKHDLMVNAGLASRAHPMLLVDENDKHLVPERTYHLLCQVERVVLLEEERVGNRRAMGAGMPGFACRHCCAAFRKGMCRFFSARRRTLPSKIKDLEDHLFRCSVCPDSIKDDLRRMETPDSRLDLDVNSSKTFFDRIWSRLHMDTS